MDFPNWLSRLCEMIGNRGGRALLVGGAVRDRFLGLPSKDFDLEVYGLSGADLRHLLEARGTVNAVGEQFVVYKFRPQVSPGDEADVSLPRRESKSGRGHRGFTIEGDPGMSFFEATRRRDFTINALMLDPLTGEIIDPQDGLRDLKSGLLRVVDPETFIEDSLRVLRGAQFAARFEFQFEPETVSLCRSIALDDLPPERVWGEFEKILVKANRPSIGFLALDELGALEKCFPEFSELKANRTEAPATSWTRTLAALDRGWKNSGDLSPEKKVAVMLAISTHAFEPAVGFQKAESLLNRLGLFTLNGYDVRKQVLALVSERKNFIRLTDCSPVPPDGDFRRLSLRVDGALFFRLCQATAFSENEKGRAERFWKRFRSLGLDLEQPRPILLGRHVLEMGVRPGPQVGRITRLVFERQLDGEVNSLEEAWAVALGILTEQV